MGQAIAALGWPRHEYVLSTKLFWGIHDVPNMRNTLNRKYLLHAVDGSLERLDVELVDILYCHRADPDTSIEETTWAMSDIVSSGRALYWGTSEWAADEIRAAWEIAERHHLHKPVVEQPQYNLLHRRRVERELRQAVRGHRARPDDVEPARLRAADRQVPGGHPGGQPGDPAGLRVAAPPPHRPRGQRQGRRPRRHRGRARLLARAPGHRVVRGEPPRVDRDHRRQPSGAGRREPVRPRRPRAPRRSHDGPHRRGGRSRVLSPRPTSGKRRRSPPERPSGKVTSDAVARFFPYAYEERLQLLWRPFGLRADRDGVHVDEERFVATFGRLRLETTAGERRRRPRHAGLPLVDRGRRPPVAGRRRADLRHHDGGRRLRALPRPGGSGRRRRRHSALTVTVEDLEGLVEPGSGG